MLNYKTVSLHEHTCIQGTVPSYIYIQKTNQLLVFGVLLFIQVIKEYTRTEKHIWPQTLPVSTCTSVLHFEDQQIKLHVN